jgi:hypothetical protein
MMAPELHVLTTGIGFGDISHFRPFASPGCGMDASSYRIRLQRLVGQFRDRVQRRLGRAVGAQQPGM